MNDYQIRSKVVAITTDGASNFKCALKRHGDDYETFEQLMESFSVYDEELFYLDLEDLNRAWCPMNELVDENDDVVPMNTINPMDETFSDPSDETFNVDEMPNRILQQVVDDLNAAGTVMLPSRIDCCAHEFNSIGRTDSYNAMKTDPIYCAAYVIVFKKLNAIWKANSTRLGRETFNRLLKGYKIQKPHRIRWNRIYDAVKTLIYFHPFKFSFD